MFGAAIQSDKSFARFLLLWSGQIISVIGSGLTTFALGVKIYQNTGSATQFTLSLLFGILPGFLIAPVVGALVDRWDKRKTMILSDCAGTGVALALALLAGFSTLEVWQIYIAMAAGSIITTFQWAAYNSLIPLMVTEEDLPRANGIVQSTQAMSLIASPLLAGLFLGWIGLAGIITIDVISYSAGVLTALIVPVAAGPLGTSESETPSLGSEIRAGWDYIKQRPALLESMLLFTAFNLFAGIAAALIQPLILSIGSVDVLGILMAVGGSGMLVGGLVMSISGGPKKRMQAILLSMLLGGFFLLIHGLTTNPWVIGLVAFAFLFTLPVLNTSIFTLWQLNVAPEMHGRFFTLARMVAQASLPVSYLVAGPLADYVFNPLLMPGGSLATSLGNITGVGAGRGIALIFILVGVAASLSAVIGYSRSKLRNFDNNTPTSL